MREDDPLETVEIFATLTQAEWARMLLESRGVPSTVQDVRTAGMFSPSAVGGLRLQVRRSRLEEAMRILSSQPYTAATQERREAQRMEATVCPACGSDDLAAVSARESRTGTYALRCLDCGHAFPVEAAVYLDEDFPLLPASCPECGSHRLHSVEPPADVPEPPPDRQWARCDDCAHEWEAPLEEKRSPGSSSAPRTPTPGAQGSAPAPDAPPVTCPKCASLQVMEWTKGGDEPGWARLRCLECDHAWLEGEDGSQVPLPGHELPPGGEAEAWGPACPSCAGREVEASDPPPYAAESALGSFFKHFVGRGWHRCRTCGHLWEV